MTMRVVDIAPNEAALVLLTERLEKAAERGEPLTVEEIRSFAQRILYPTAVSDQPPMNRSGGRQ
jgi:hypothetical protein